MISMKSNKSIKSTNSIKSTKLPESAKSTKNIPNRPKCQKAFFLIKYPAIAPPRAPKIGKTAIDGNWSNNANLQLLIK